MTNYLTKEIANQFRIYNFPALYFSAQQIISIQSFETLKRVPFQFFAMRGMRDFD